MPNIMLVGLVVMKSQETDEYSIKMSEVMTIHHRKNLNGFRKIWPLDYVRGYNIKLKRSKLVYS